MIERKYQQRLIKITAQPSGRDLGAIALDLEDKLRALSLPPGFTFQLAGQIQQQREAFSSLKFTSLLAIILVYMVMASQFRSLIDPLQQRFADAGPGELRRGLDPAQACDLFLSSLFGLLLGLRGPLASRRAEARQLADLFLQEPRRRRAQHRS